MICKFCSLEGRVLESRASPKSEFLRKRRYACSSGDPSHRFNTMEMPEEVFNDQSSYTLKRIVQFERGVSRRMDRAAQDRIIDKLLDEKVSYATIAKLAQCSKSKVEKRVHVRKAVNAPAPLLQANA